MLTRFARVAFGIVTIFAALAVLVLGAAGMGRALLANGGQILHEVSLAEAERAARAGFTLPARGLRWIASDVVPKRSFCGNAHMEDAVRVQLVDARILRREKGVDAALRFLLPAVRGYHHWDDTRVEDLTLAFLRERYSPAEVRRLTEDALASVHHVGPDPEAHALVFAGTQIPIYYSGPPGGAAADVRRYRFFALALKGL